MLTETDPARLNQIPKELQADTPLRELLPKFYRPESMPADVANCNKSFYYQRSCGWINPVARKQTKQRTAIVSRGFIIS